MNRRSPRRTGGSPSLDCSPLAGRLQDLRCRQPTTGSNLSPTPSPPCFEREAISLFPNPSPRFINFDCLEWKVPLASVEVIGARLTDADTKEHNHDLSRRDSD